MIIYIFFQNTDVPFKDKTMIKHNNSNAIIDPNDIISHILIY